MKILISIGIYLLAGIAGGKIFGYCGLIDIVVWPITVPIAIYLRIKRNKGGD